jgi:hypothetical protein
MKIWQCNYNEQRHDLNANGDQIATHEAPATANVATLKTKTERTIANNILKNYNNGWNAQCNDFHQQNCFANDDTSTTTTCIRTNAFLDNNVNNATMLANANWENAHMHEQHFNQSQHTIVSKHDFDSDGSHRMSASQPVHNITLVSSPCMVSFA